MMCSEKPTRENEKAGKIAWKLKKSNLNSKVSAGMVWEILRYVIVPRRVPCFPIFLKIKLEEDSLGSAIFFSQMVFAECCPSASVTSNSSVESNPAYLQIATLWLTNIMPKIDLQTDVFALENG